MAKEKKKFKAKLKIPDFFKKDLQVVIKSLVIIFMCIAVLIFYFTADLKFTYGDVSLKQNQLKDTRNEIDTLSNKLVTTQTDIENTMHALNSKKGRLGELGVARVPMPSVDVFLRYVDTKSSELGLDLLSTDIRGDKSDKYIDCKVKGPYDKINLLFNSLNTQQVIYVVDLDIYTTVMSNDVYADFTVSLKSPKKDKNNNVMSTKPTDTKKEDIKKEDDTKKEDTKETDKSTTEVDDTYK